MLFILLWHFQVTESHSWALGLVSLSRQIHKISNHSELIFYHSLAILNFKSWTIGHMLASYLVIFIHLVFSVDCVVIKTNYLWYRPNMQHFLLFSSVVTVTTCFNLSSDHRQVFAATLMDASCLTSNVNLYIWCFAYVKCLTMIWRQTETCSDSNGRGEEKKMLHAKWYQR
jgi:hypothetical protein